MKQSKLKKKSTTFKRKGKQELCKTIKKFRVGNKQHPKGNSNGDKEGKSDLKDIMVRQN